MTPLIILLVIMILCFGILVGATITYQILEGKNEDS